MQITPNASYSLTLRVKLSTRAGTLGEVSHAPSAEPAATSAPLTSSASAAITSFATSPSTPFPANTRDAIVEAVKAIDGVEVINVSDRTFLMHLGGKIEVVSKMPLKTRADLSMAYTPGVARVCEAIHEDPEKVFTLTIKKNTVAIVTDGTAVLGLGDIGPAAAMPVMEGKAMLFKEFARRRRLSDLSEHERPGRDRAHRQSNRHRVSAASTWKTFPRRAVSRSKSD